MASRRARPPPSVVDTVGRVRVEEALSRVVAAMPSTLSAPPRQAASIAALVTPLHRQTAGTLLAGTSVAVSNPSATTGVPRSASNTNSAATSGAPTTTAERTTPSRRTAR